MTHVFSDLELISLDFPRAGFHHFLGTWLLRWEDRAFLVDPGPSATVPHLVEELTKRSIHRLDGVLLTHIHIDHSGGVGSLIEHIPVDWIECHPKSIPHLVEPSKLWKGSLQVLGDVAEMYGPILPIPKDLLCSRNEIPVGDKRIQVVDTPGHAPHHLCFLAEGYVFTGEAAGVNFPLDEGIYLRPSTPPKFDYNIFLSSLDKLLLLELPEVICFGHFGYQKDARAFIEGSKKQVMFWYETVRQMPGASDEEILERVYEHDPFFGFDRLPEDARQRELIFLHNTLEGMRQSLFSTSS